MAPVDCLPQGIPVLLDLLDDWTVHQAFRGIAEPLEAGYAAWFRRATHVTANSEGTVALANRFGRDDVRQILNGCDPERFQPTVAPHTQFTVGYGGKIGHRLDVDLVERVAREFPALRFVFAGPVLDKPVGTRLEALPNVALLGDIQYERYPAVMRDWDIAWAPHALGDREVGGDLIKLYEYRAAGLKVASTKVIGWQRFPEGIAALEPSEFSEWIATQVAQPPGRDRYATPTEHTWRAKTSTMLELLGL